MGLIVSSSGIQIEVNGRMARVIAYLVAHATTLNMDGSTSGKLLILWDKDWLRCRKEQDLPPEREPIDTAPA